MINQTYTVKITNGRITIPIEVRRRFGFLNKKVKINGDISDGGFVLDFNRIKS